MEIAAARAWLDSRSQDSDRDIINQLETARAILRTADLYLDSREPALLDACLHHLRFEQRRLEQLGRMAQHG